MDTDDLCDSSKNFIKDSKDIKRSLKINSSSRKTIVYIVAVSNDYLENQTIFLSSIGTPITKEVYDGVRDGYVVFGIDSYKIGEIPVSYQMELPESNWNVEIPLPMSIINRYLTKIQKNNLNAWKNKFDKEKHYFETFHSLGVY